MRWKTEPSLRSSNFYISIFVSLVVLESGDSFNVSRKFQQRESAAKDRVYTNGLVYFSFL